VPRKARKKSGSGICHIVMRGINRQNIFEDKEDNQRFLEIFHQYKEVSGYKVYAYCLMGNHVHLSQAIGEIDRNNQGSHSKSLRVKKVVNNSVPLAPYKYKTRFQQTL